MEVFYNGDRPRKMKKVGSHPGRKNRPYDYWGLVEFTPARPARIGVPIGLEHV